MGLATKRHAAMALACATLLLPFAPTVVLATPRAEPPTVDFRQGVAVSDGRVPLTVRWPAATPNDSPIYRYQLQRRVDGGPWRTVRLASRLATSVTMSVRPFRLLELRVRAHDEAGSASAWSSAAPTWLGGVQESAPEVELSAGWHEATDTEAFGGSKATTSEASQTASYQFHGHEIAWIAERGPDRGSAAVYVNDAYLATVNLHASRIRPPRVVFRAELSDNGPHTIRIDTDAADGAVVLDAFVAMGGATTETLVGAGDISRCENDGDTKTAAVVSGVPGIVYTTGDNVYLSGTPDEFATCYDPTWGAFKDRTRPSPGNHDYVTPGATGYYGYFGDAAGPAGKGWYRYDAGTWRVYSLNSECLPECAAEQYDWLAVDLAAEPHRCVIAYWHRPIFSTGSHGPSSRMALFFQLLYDSGAELVLVGHDHHYERFAPARPDGTIDAARGIRQIVVGTGGSALYGFRTTSSLSEVRSNSTHGVLRVDLAPGRYSWEFLPVEGGAFTDSGTGDCH
jgi:hypothetical protein